MLPEIVSKTSTSFDFLHILIEYCGTLFFSCIFFQVRWCSLKDDHFGEHFGVTVLLLRHHLQYS
jgi:hypothetical protein